MLKKKAVDDIMGGEDAWANVDKTQAMDVFPRSIDRSFRLRLEWLRIKRLGSAPPASLEVLCLFVSQVGFNSVQTPVGLLAVVA